MQFIAERNKWEQHLGKGKRGRRGGKRGKKGRAIFLSKTVSHRGNISYIFKGCTEETFWREIQHLHEGLWEFSTCVSLFLHGKIPGSSCVVWKTVGIHSQCGYFFYRYCIELRTWLFKLCKKKNLCHFRCNRFSAFVTRQEKVGGEQKLSSRAPALFL